MALGTKKIFGIGKKDGKMKRIILTAILLMAFAWCDGQTIEQVRTEIHRQGLPHANIVLAQARLETGNFTSRMCKTKHNLFGIKHNGRYATYKTWQESIADYKRCISSRYKGGDYYLFLKRIGYAEEKEYIKKIRKIANGMARH